MYKRWGKRSLDIVLAGMGLIILFPLFIFLALLLRLSDGGKPVFSQPRPGLNGKAFILFKFRSMREIEPVKAVSYIDPTRITPIGKILRRYSLDELPQLWNVIRGDMSLIGPRPLLNDYLPLYSAFQKRRHDVKPGITGWAQVNGRNALDWNNRLAMDVWYTENISLKLDLYILYRTALVILKPVADETDLPDEFRG